MQKQQNKNHPFFLSIFFFFLMTSISIPLQAQKDDAYEDEYAALLSRMIEKGYATYQNNDFLGPVAYWQKLWDRVNGSSTWIQLMDNIVLRQAQRTEYNGSTGITKVLLTRSDRVAWIAFPGVGENDAANLESGTTNDFPKWRGHSDMDVHQYYFNEYEGLKPQIATWLATHKNEFDKVIVTGHSKGGVLSQYFLADFLDLYPNKRFHLVAFGSPNSGNENFINYWANKSNLIRAVFYTTQGKYYRFLASNPTISDVITYNSILKRMPVNVCTLPGILPPMAAMSRFRTVMIVTWCILL